jgi:SRSO17 transposase
MAYLRGLMGPAGRKSSWQLAAAGGEPTPYGVQHLLHRAQWDSEALRDELRGFILEHLRDSIAVLVIANARFPKKGRHRAGVARQSSGTAGSIENCQVGVFLGYAGRHTQPLLDRELYLPVAWTDETLSIDAEDLPDGVTCGTVNYVLQILSNSQGTIPIQQIAHRLGKGGTLRSWS